MSASASLESWRCNHDKCKNLKLLLRHSPPYAKWIFLELNSPSLIRPEVMNYLDEHISLDQSRLCISVETMSGARYFQVLLSVEDETESQKLLKSLIHGHEHSRLFLGEFCAATPLMDCMHAFIADAPFWVGALSAQSIVLGSRALIDDFAKYVRGVLTDEAALMAQIVRRTPDSSFPD